MPALRAPAPFSSADTMAQRIGREYSHSQAKTVFRNLLDLSGKVEITAASVVVTLDKRAQSLPGRLRSDRSAHTDALVRQQKADYSIRLRSPPQRRNTPFVLTDLLRVEIEASAAR